MEFFKPEGSACRLIFFYSFLFKRSPIVVFNVPQRESGEKYADLPAAVRDVADIYDLRVIVDSSPDSIPPQLLTTKREIAIVFEPMPHVSFI